MTDILHYTLTDRGFRHLPALEISDGGRIEIWESSQADEPHIWFSTQAPHFIGDHINRDYARVRVSLSLQEVDDLVLQLLWLKANHYQVSDA